MSTKCYENRENNPKQIMTNFNSSNNIGIRIDTRDFNYTESLFQLLSLHITNVQAHRKRIKECLNYPQIET